ncbi:GNAT family N-acetyltransferase [Siccirubricoccus phaeus]|uniref:GNAT family N-acetyltransferase n=1 Tax=Siccirubricoccus phaeus TaxID=2595053 RepID=UPI0011F1CB5F|nr:GNAT family N-acetyltransferase [Siccirubricoccus phaeus]
MPDDEAGPAPRLSAVPVRDFAALGAEWRGLEARAAPFTPFQSWSWVGCLAAERYADPVLLRAERDGRLLGLALCNRRAGRLCLAEAGEAALDAPFIEHNAPLLAAEAGPELAAALLRRGWLVPGVRWLVLSGVAPGLAAAAGGTPWRWQARPAPWVDLAALRAAGQSHLAALSANARQQLRRALRGAERHGKLRLERAATPAEAAAFLDQLMALHGASWRARGKPGAFATTFARRFHQALVAEALPRGEVDLLRVSAGARVLGLLYNLRRSGRIHAYQSGFDLAGEAGRDRPGLVCHHLAIEAALAEGAACYDFLAGEARYKRSLANAEAALVWAELVPRWSAAGLLARARRGRLGQGVQRLVRRCGA